MLFRAAAFVAGVVAFAPSSQAADLSMTPIYAPRPLAAVGVKVGYPTIKYFDQRYVEPQPRTGGIVAGAGPSSADDRTKASGRF